MIQEYNPKLRSTKWLKKRGDLIYGNFILNVCFMNTKIGDQGVISVSKGSKSQHENGKNVNKMSVQTTLLVAFSVKMGI